MPYAVSAIGTAQFSVAYGVLETAELAFVTITVDIDPGCDDRADWLGDSGLAAYGLLEETTEQFEVSLALPADADGVSWSEVCGYAELEAVLDDASFSFAEVAMSPDEPLATVYIIPPKGSHGSYVLTLARQSKCAAAGNFNPVCTAEYFSNIRTVTKDIEVFDMDCMPAPFYEVLSGDLAAVQRRGVFRQATLQDFQTACPSAFAYTSSLEWVTFDAPALTLIVQAPRTVTDVQI